MRRKTLILTTLIVALCTFWGCSDAPEPSADKKARNESEMALAEAFRQIGMPEIVNFQQLKLMKTVYELCDREDLICHAYIKSDYLGRLFYVGKCMGYGIPFSAQYTNPMKIVDGPCSGCDPKIVPQADPNALFMPTSSSATWLMMIDPETNEPRPVYFEPEIVVSPFPLHEVEEPAPEPGEGTES